MYLTPAGSEITEQINVLFSTGTSDASFFSYFRTRNQPLQLFSKCLPIVQIEPRFEINYDSPKSKLSYSQEGKFSSSDASF